jgi:hypothetical protein
MFFRGALGFVNKFVEELSNGLSKHQPEARLSQPQRDWLAFCLMGILVTNSVCWARFERASLGEYQLAELSAMFRNSPISWDKLFHESIRVILRKYNIAEGVLVADDTDNKRAKTAPLIYRIHKVFDKKTSGYFNGQTIVFIILVSGSLTIPVGFAFYQPDPAIQA